MGSKKKFIMKFAVTVCLLTILLFEGFFLYCRYVKHVSTTQYAAEKLQMAGDWFFRSSTQTASAKTPAGRKALKKEFAPSDSLLVRTAEDAIRELVTNDTFVIPEVVSETIRPLEEKLEEEVEGEVEQEEVSANADPTDQPKETDIPEAEDKPELVTAANPTGMEITNIQDLLKRQADDGIEENTQSRVQLEAESILQQPELPTGCEVTSLTMALRFAGYDVSKEELADQYLEKAAPGEVSYKTAFWGDPRQEESFGCYAPVIVKAANQYLAQHKSAQIAYNLTGASLDDVLAEVRMGYPVIVWGSMYINEEIVFSYGWEIEGETVTWPSNEHCMLLIGFDTETNSVIVCDPLEGIVSYDRNAFQHHYEILEQQAIVIY